MNNPPDIESIGLDNAYRLLTLYLKQIEEAAAGLGKLRSDLARRRNYIRICDLPEEGDRMDESS